MSEPDTFAVWPPAGSPLSLTSWWRELVGLAECIAVPPPFPEDAARGRGQHVIVLPGFCSPNLATARLRDFLTRQGFRPRPWDLGINFGPTSVTLRSLERQIVAAANECGAPIALVGLSLGGTIAREMAKRQPDLVSRVITLASPIRVPVATTLAPLAKLASELWDKDSRADLSRIAEPPPVPVTAIITRSDGLIDWQSCVPEPAPNVEAIIIEGMHVTIGSNPAAQRIVAARLALS